jgi:Flp pilus assembly protein TadD
MSIAVLPIFNEGVDASLRAHRSRENGEFERANTLDQRAIAAFDEVLGVDPSHLGAISGKGLCLAQLGRALEAMQCFQRATELDPQFAENHRQLGLCHAELGHIAPARTATRRALELDGSPEQREQAAYDLCHFGHRAMGRAAEYRGQSELDMERRCYKHAQELFALALEVDPGCGPARDGMDEARRGWEGRLQRPWWRVW